MSKAFSEYSIYTAIDRGHLGRIHSFKIHDSLNNLHGRIITPELSSQWTNSCSFSPDIFI